MTCHNREHFGGAEVSDREVIFDANGNAIAEKEI